MTAINGGNFWNGFAAGALSSIAASAFSADLNGSAKEGLGWGGVFRKSDAGMIAFGTLAGGAGAALTGGNFWQGAVTGLVVSGLNHAMHKMESKDSVTLTKTTNKTANPEEKPYVLNQSKKTIYYKPEETSEALPLGPGEKTYDPVDGINVRGKVYKVSDGYTSITVKSNFRVVMNYNNSWFYESWKALYSGGLKERSDFKINTGWDNLFNIKK